MKTGNLLATLIPSLSHPEADYGGRDTYKNRSVYEHWNASRSKVVKRE
jgi:hypothetical protein